MKIHFIQHESFEAPGAYKVWAKKNNHEITYTKVYKFEKLPEEVNHDLLIILGGPQDPNTTTEECPHFDAKAEIDFIQKSIKKNKKIIGICLGAQLIGEALDSNFSNSPEKEIGLFDLILTSAAKKDPYFSRFNNSIPCGHWHGDIPGLTDKSEILAYTEGCPRQIIKYSNNIYGFQCHFEFTPDVIELMIQNCSHELEKFKDCKFVQNENKLRSNNYEQANQILFDFLDYFTSN